MKADTIPAETTTRAPIATVNLGEYSFGGPSGGAAVVIPGMADVTENALSARRQGISEKARLSSRERACREQKDLLKSVWLNKQRLQAVSETLASVDGTVSSEELANQLGQARMKYEEAYTAAMKVLVKAQRPLEQAIRSYKAFFDAAEGRPEKIKVFGLNAHPVDGPDVPEDEVPLSEMLNDQSGRHPVLDKVGGSVIYRPLDQVRNTGSMVSHVVLADEYTGKKAHDFWARQADKRNFVVFGNIPSRLCGPGEWSRVQADTISEEFGGKEDFYRSSLLAANPPIARQANYFETQCESPLPSLTVSPAMAFAGLHLRGGNGHAPVRIEDDALCFEGLSAPSFEDHAADEMIAPVAFAVKSTSENARGQRFHFSSATSAHFARTPITDTVAVQYLQRIIRHYLMHCVGMPSSTTMAKKIGMDMNRKLSVLSRGQKPLFKKLTVDFDEHSEIYRESDQGPDIQRHQVSYQLNGAIEHFSVLLKSTTGAE